MKIKCTWNLDKNKWAEAKQINENISSNLIWGSWAGDSTIGFYCNENEIDEYIEKLKNSEIEDIENQIKMLQIQLENIKKIEKPKIKGLE
jgi:hypothetical protein